MVRPGYVLQYQPIVDAANPAITEPIGIEALIRLKQGDVLRPPSEFLPDVAEHGLALAVGDWVMHEAFRQTREWQLAGAVGAQYIAINISDQQFLDPGLSDRIKKLLEDMALHHTLVHFEISEHATLSGKRAQDQVRAMQECGVTVELDDLGVGNGHLHVLADLGVTALKIDKSYIDKCLTLNGAHVLKSLVTLAQALRLSVTAEGVETEPQARFLREIGCNRMQGYLFSRPVSAHECVKLLKVGSNLGVNASQNHVAV